MSLKISVLIDQKVLSITTDISYFKKIYMQTHILEPLDHIYEVSITKDLLIITTEDPDFRNGNLQAPPIKEERLTNNINAYDWGGNHMWNIADIVGDIKMSFFGGSVCTKKSFNSYWGFNASRVKNDHELFSCTAGDYLYIIDLTDKKFIQKLDAK